MLKFPAAGIPVITPENQGPPWGDCFDTPLRHG